MNDWKTVRLGDVATYINGYAFKPSDWGTTGLPIIRIQNLTGNDYETNFFNGEIHPKYTVKDGDVLISWSASLGVYEWNKGKALLNQHIFKVVFDKIEVDKKYFIFTVSHLLNEMTKHTHGSTMRHITKPDFDNMPFPLPSIKEQKKISELLEKCTSIIATNKQMLEKYDMLIKSRFIEMFGDPVKNSLGWEVRKLKETTDIITGNTPSRKDKENYGTFIEWIKTDNITDKTYVTTAAEYLSEKGEMLGRTVEAGSILMACIAGSLRSIGRVALTNRKVAFNQQINAIVPKKYNSLFLYVLFQNTQSYAQSTVNMALKGILSKGKLEELEYILPPIELQNNFAAFVQQIDKSKFAVQKSLEKAETLYKSLMQEYFG